MDLIYECKHAFENPESVDGFININHLLEKESYLLRLLTISDEDFSRGVFECLAKIEEAKTERAEYKHRAKTEFLADVKYYRHRIEELTELLSSLADCESDCEWIKMSIAEYQQKKRNNYKSGYYYSCVVSASEEIKLYKKILEIACDKATFIEAVKAEIKRNRAEIKKQLDF